MKKGLGKMISVCQVKNGDIRSVRQQVIKLQIITYLSMIAVASAVVSMIILILNFGGM